MTDDRFASIMQRLEAWADADDNIRAVIVTGSSSRADRSADRFSDRDVELIVRRPDALLDNDEWIHGLAPVMVAQYLDNDDIDHPPTRLVFFEGARKVDFTIADPSRVQEMIETRQLNPLYQRGFRVLVDKDGFAGTLPAPGGSHIVTESPTQESFDAVITEFWFEAAHMPTYLARGDLWVVKFRDQTMKAMLLQMIEWHALATRGTNVDTWYIGTRMQRWADPGAWHDVYSCFGRFDREDSYRAALATMRLFDRLALVVAETFGCAYEDRAERSVLPYVEDMGEHIMKETPDLAGRT